MAGSLKILFKPQRIKSKKKTGASPKPHSKAYAGLIITQCCSSANTSTPMANAYPNADIIER
ncbi:MAG: hypothetical protein HY836_06245 [Aquabacterium sp.]|nr:hypothetical protein [Aquabacterium sp.]